MNQKETILLTGGSGFLGKYLLNSCAKLSTRCVTTGRTQITQSWKHLTVDWAKSVPNLPDLSFSKVIHAAGKAHVYPKTPAEEKDFFDVNVRGTRNLLEALDRLSYKPQSFVFISSVAVYGLTSGKGIKESTPLLANTPYGKSKVEAEKIVQEWCIANHVPFLILRIPLLAGKNPPGNLGDMMRAIKKGRYIKIGNNHARKSIVLAEDVSDFILNFDSDTSGIFHLTDGIHPTFSEIEKAFEINTGRKIRIKLPIAMARIMAKLGDMLTTITKKDILPISSPRLDKITSPLTFNDAKSRQRINWQSGPVLDFIKTEI